MRRDALRGFFSDGYCLVDFVVVVLDLALLAVEPLVRPLLGCSARRSCATTDVVKAFRLVRLARLLFARGWRRAAEDARPLTQSKGLSDSDKMLLQLLLDVRQFGSELQALLGPHASAEADCAPFRQLCELVAPAERFLNEPEATSAEAASVEAEGD